MSSPGRNLTGRVKVWDRVVRLLHWSLAGLVVFDMVWDDGGYAHRMVGYAGAGVVLARLTWTALSRSHGSLCPSIPQTLSYVRQLGRGKPPRAPGHDPLGLWMVWLLWILVLLLGLTGWMTRLDAFWGDDLVHGIHSLLADLLAIAVVLHLAGVGLMSWLWRENLPAAMIEGSKRAFDER